MALDIPEWVDLIGKPFRYGGRGPEEYDCYGLLMELHKRSGVLIPDYATPINGKAISALFSEESAKHWRKIDRCIGATVLFRVPGNTHVGLIIDNMRMIHCWERSSGVLTERIDLWERKVIGYYEYVGKSN